MENKASISESFDGSSETLKRKRIEDEFGPRATLDSTIDVPKRPKHKPTPYPPSARCGSDESFKVRVSVAPPCSATTAVYDPGYNPRAQNDSESSGVLSSDQGSNGYYKNSQLDLPRMRHQRPAQCISNEGSDSAIRKSTRKSKPDSMTVVERKHFLIYTQTEGIKAAVKKNFSDICQLLDMSGLNDDCRLHPTPPFSKGKPAGTISFGFSWRDKYGFHRLGVNWGIIALIALQKLTNAQTEGFIHNSWHLSHLCGNWTCCNWKHFTVESGPININRNGCFNSPAKCTHSPPCMKKKKRRFLVTNHIRSVISKAISSLDDHLLYEIFDALGKYEIRLVKWFWKNSKQGSCAFCGRSDDQAHVYPCLSTLVDCKVTLKALKQCAEPTSEMTEAIGYLAKIKEDLERGSALKDTTLAERLIRPRGSRISLAIQTRLNYLRLKVTEKELRTKRTELRFVCRQSGRTAEDVGLLSEVRRSCRKTTVAVNKARRKRETFARLQGGS